MLSHSFTVYRIDESGRWHEVAKRKTLARAWALCRQLAKANPGTEYRLN